MWWAIAVAGAVVFVVLILALLQKTRWSAGAASSAPGNAVERERSPSSDAAADGVVTSNAAAGRAAASDTCHEVIDHYSGTYIEHCAPKRPGKRPSATEIHESQRRADEAVRVLEATTPEK